MADRIDTDAIRNTAIAGDPNAAAVQALCDEVDRLRALADPAPVGLTASVPLIGTGAGEVETAPAGDRERVPEGWRVEWTQASHESFAMPRLVPVSASVDPEEG